MKNLILLIFIILITGCNSIPKAVKYYDGPERNEAEISIFSFWMNQKFKGEFASYAKVYPKELNGKKMPAHSTFAVLPGSHNLVAACKWNDQEFTHTYKVKTLKGKNYAIVIHITDERCIFEDLQYVSEKDGFTLINT